MSIQLELGKQYVRRDGEVTGPLEPTSIHSEYHETHPFRDPRVGHTYTKNGEYEHEKESHIDLVVEFESDYDHLGDLQREHNERQDRDAKEQACWESLRVPGAADTVGSDFWNDYFKGHETKDTNPKDSIGCTKPPLHTVPTGPLFEAGAVLLHGHCKYRGYNWRVAGVRSSIYYDAVMRHMMAWWEGEDNDPDSGLPHIAHAISGLCVLRDSQMAMNCTDDRPPIRVHPFNALRPLVADMARDPQPEPYTQNNTQ